MKNESVLKDKAKMHYDALMENLKELGMSLGEFEDEMEKEPAGEEEGGDYEEPSDDEEMKGPHGPDKTKVALIIAKMRNGMKKD